MKYRKSKRARQEWWQSMTNEEQSAFIALKEQSRKVKNSNKPLPKDEVWTNSSGRFTKHWINRNSYSVTRLKMLDKA